MRTKVWILISLGLAAALPTIHGQTANTDFYIAPAGQVFSVAAPGVLANDTGGGQIMAVLATPPANGTLTLNTNGSFVYTPTNNFTGVDGFTYYVHNMSHNSGTASVLIMVTPAGQLFYDNGSRPAGTNAVPLLPWITQLSPQVAGSWGITNNVLIGTGPITNYAICYFPSNSWSNYSVQAQIRFSSDNASSAGILGRLNTVNGSHYAAWIYPEHSPEFLASGNGTALLRLIKYQTWGYPWYLMGNPVTLPAVGVGWHTVKMTFQGSTISVFYDGNLVLSLTDDGSYDGTAAYLNGGIGCNLWTLPPASYAFSLDNIIVSTSNAVANYDAFPVTSNLTLNVPAPGVLANDTGNGPLTAFLSSGPAHGSLVLTNNGGFSYVPASGFTGPDSFTYLCTDGQTTSAVTTVTLSVNNAAVARNDAYSTTFNTPLVVSAPGVLANDRSGNGSLTAKLVTGPAAGTFSLSGNGSFTYTPTAGFSGYDSFTYVATDGQSTSGVATVSLLVLPLPTANPDFYNVPAGTSTNVPAPGVLANDLGGNGPLTALLMSNPAHGSLSWSGNGSFSYQPATNYLGLDSFTYVVTDGQNTSSVATVTLMVEAPGELFHDTFTRPAGSNSIYPWTQQSGTWNITNNLMLGTSAFGSYGYAYAGNTAWSDYFVQAQIRFSTTNAWGGAIGGRLNPVSGARYDVWVFPEGSPWGPLSGAPGGVAYLQMNKYSTWTAYTQQNLVRLPAMGTNWHTLKLAFRGPNVFAYFDGLQYTNLNDNGSFDGQPAYTNGAIALELWTQSPAAYTLSVSNVFVTPLVLNNSYSVNENHTLTVPNPGVLTNDTDVYGTNLTAALVNGPANGTLNLNTNGAFTYTPTANFSGTDSFTVQASDKLNPLGTATVSINVLPVPVTNAPAITSIGLTNSIVQITWLSQSGTLYRLQYNDNLGSTNWTDVTPDVMATGSTASQTNTLNGSTHRFYRIRVVGS